MPGEWWTDDTVLLARLEQAWSAVQQVPAEFVDAGRAAFVPSDVDAELAELTYDSQCEPAGTRNDTAPLRALTFSSASQTIELEVTGDALLGQLVPPCATRIEVQPRDGRSATVDSDQLGVFTVTPVPDGPFRLRYRTPSGVSVVTGWIAI
ncbi:MAG: hypothetical protein J2P15_04075 [Micromonosporaceae bacterium]|nr:hypothetical protein [Micromonosporaceae bacterium]